MVVGGGEAHSGRQVVEIGRVWVFDMWHFGEITFLSFGVSGGD